MHLASGNVAWFTNRRSSRGEAAAMLTTATAANTNARKPSGRAILDDGRWGRARDWWFGGPWSAFKGPGTRPAQMADSGVMLTGLRGGRKKEIVECLAKAVTATAQAVLHGALIARANSGGPAGAAVGGRGPGVQGPVGLLQNR